jgi:hypothetical protein
MVNILNARLVKKNDYITRGIAGETIIVPIRNRAGDLDSIYTLNELGTSIWQLIDGKTNVNQIVEGICQDYDIAPDVALKDILDYLQSLEDAGLIEVK